jgi:hypothetical protein
MSNNYTKQQGPIGYAWLEPLNFNFGPIENTMRFYVIEQQKVVIDNNGNTVNTGQNYVEQYYNPDLVIPVLDTTTMQPTGQTITFKQLYDYMYSLYVKAATERDQRFL